MSQDNNNENGEYRYTGTGLHRSDGFVARGEVITPTDAELRAFGDLLQPIATHEPAPASAPATDEGGDETGDAGDAAGGEPFGGYDDYTVSELRDTVGDLDTGVLEAALQYEEAHEARTTAIEAIETELDARYNGTEE